jgi:hypothetical protein
MRSGRSVPNRLAFWAAVGALFALAYSQSPLYTSNQNQYFLHGLASAGYGHLSQDWLANTLDPTPVFSWLVQATYASVGAWFFYIEYGLLLGVTFWGLYAIGGSLLPGKTTRSQQLVLLLFVTGLFSEALRFPLSHMSWADGGYLLEGGVAGQRLLGPVFEPSVFGGLLVVSVALFIRGHPHAAALLAAAAATVHPTYLLTSGALVAAYIGVLGLGDRRWRAAITTGGLALLGVVPILVHTLTVFGWGSSQVSADASRVLVEFRIPHHTLVSQWLGPSVAIKMLLILGALLVVRRRRLFPILLAPALIGLALTAVQLATGNNRLALLFPWRVSALLVPVSTTLLATRLMGWCFGQPDKRQQHLPPWAGRAAWAIMAVLAVAGFASFIQHLQARNHEPQQRLFNEVRRMAAPGQVFLIPPKLQAFRLDTGEPAFVDFKAIPYAPAEVLAWYDRIQLAQFFYRDNPADIDCHLLYRAAAAGVTHVVLEPAQQGADCEMLHKLWGDDQFQIDSLKP